MSKQRLRRDTTEQRTPPISCQGLDDYECRPRHLGVTQHWLKQSLFTLLMSGVLLAVFGREACAQSNAPLAEALFDDGKRLLDAGKYTEACGKFEESQKLDPATGTLLNLANCYEHVGRLATAWATWREAASSARAANQLDREELARQMAGKLEPRLARLTIHVAGSENLPIGFTLTQDNAPQPTAAWGISLPIDAGAHHFEARAPGFIPWSSDAAVRDGQKIEVSVPILALEGSLPPVLPPPPPEPETDPSPLVSENNQSSENDEEAASTGGNRLKGWGIVLTSIGAVGLTAGTYFGIHAISKNNSSKDNCSLADPNACSADGKAQRDAALTSATAANLLIGLGVAAATTGVVFLIVSSKNKDTTVSVAPAYGGGQLSLSGAF